MKQQLIKKIFTCIFAVILLFALMPSAVFAEDGEQVPIDYLDKDGNTQQCEKYEVIHDYGYLTELTSQYYVVFDDIEIAHLLTVKGNVNLILADGCHLKVLDHISMPEGNNSLTIYAQSEEKGTMGELSVNERRDDSINNRLAGIEVNSKSSGLTICGGSITVWGGYCGAGIGGNDECDGGKVTIYGGDILVNGNNSGAGIGGGDSGDCGEVTIYGGNVEAYGGPYGGAGIGGGEDGDADAYDIVIYGGNVKAFGGYSAAGIGGGCYGNAGTVKIYGGNVEAKGLSGGAGIGGGEENLFGIGGEFEKFEFYGGSVKAEASILYDEEGNAKRGMAIGAGSDGDDDVTYTLPLGNDNLLINNETGKIVDTGFNPNFSQILHEYGREQSCNLSIVPTSEYPVSYLTQDIYGETIESECKEDYKLFYYNQNYTLELPSGWYVMIGEGEYENGIEIQGNVHLILTDGCTLTVQNGIRIPEGAELTIYGQSEGETAGKLIAYGTYYKAGIGGSGNSIDGGSCGKLTIRGGNVVADGSYNDGAGACAGVGGICNWPDIKPVELTMYDGVLTAIGRYGSPGIGGCRKAPGGIVNIYGGTINAESRDYGYSSMTNRAIGGYVDNPDNGTVYVGNNVVLTDNNTGEILTKESGEEWIDKFAAPSISITATNEFQPVSYLYYDEEIGSYETEICEKYLRPDYKRTEWESGWYVVNDEYTYDQTLSINGDVHLILTDGCKMKAAYGIIIQEGASFSIHAQSTGDRMGELEAFRTQSGDSADGQSGIRTIGPLYIHGGKVTATGGYRGAGIGGGCQIMGTAGQPGGNVTVYGGNVTAMGGTYAAGIGGGGGDYGDGGTLNVYGGIITAEGGTYAAGIGGGYNEHGGFSNPEKSGKGGNLNIYGGRVTATGGKNAPHGIGGAMEATDNGTITVGEGLALIDLDTDKRIQKENGKDWTEILSDPTLSFRAIRWMDTVDYLAYDEETGELTTETIDGDDCVFPDQLMNQWSDGWYGIQGSPEFKKRVEVTGDVNLILLDGCNLNVPEGIHVGPKSTLTIYAQSIGEEAGKITAGTDELGFAAIGGNDRENSGTITINGGTIEAVMESSGAGIGGGSAGVGRIVVNNGEVTAQSAYGAGIGSGSGCSSPAEVTIHGGTVHAQGTKRGGAGIGGGMNGVAHVTIMGGTVDAVSENGEAIRAGKNGSVLLNPAGGRELLVKTEGKEITGSPFASETDITGIVNKKLSVYISDKNSESDVPDEPGTDVPETGDRNNSYLWLAIFLAGAIILAGGIFFITKKKK